MSSGVNHRRACMSRLFVCLRVCVCICLAATLYIYESNIKTEGILVISRYSNNTSTSHSQHWHNIMVLRVCTLVLSVSHCSQCSTSLENIQNKALTNMQLIACLSSARQIIFIMCLTKDKKMILKKNLKPPIRTRNCSSLSLIIY